MFLIFGLKRKDVWPSSDFGIRKSLTKLSRKKEMLSAEKVEIYGKRWTPYRSYAALYIWKSQ
jgi:DNA-3-methyladenine glycosylase II